jgi:pimeloyl-ACP methyl ester carboxylesterase
MESSIIRRSRFVGSGIAAAVAATLPQGAIAKSTATKNIVLVHGAWSDGSAWSKVIPTLQRAGHNVVAVQNQMADLASDSKNTRAAIDALAGPTVVVGHSYGGAVVTSAALGADNVVALVYIAAFAPDEGETLGDIIARFPPRAGQYITPGPGGLLYIDRAHMSEAFSADLSPAEGAVLAAVQRPVAAAIFERPMGKPAWKSRKTWFQVSANDRLINPDAQRFMAERMGAVTITLPSSHASLVSHPREVANLILRACQV